MQLNTLYPKSLSSSVFTNADMTFDGFDMAALDRAILPNYGYVADDNIVHMPAAA